MVSKQLMGPEEVKDHLNLWKVIRMCKQNKYSKPGPYKKVRATGEFWNHSGLTQQNLICRCHEAQVGSVVVRADSTPSSRSRADSHLSYRVFKVTQGVGIQLASRGREREKDHMRGVLRQACMWYASLLPTSHRPGLSHIVTAEVRKKQESVAQR